MLARIHKFVALAYLFLSTHVGAACPASVQPNNIAFEELSARVTTVLGLQELVVDIIQPAGISAACLVFRKHPGKGNSMRVFELELPGQLGLHVVVLNKEYLVVESGTGNGSFMSEIFALKGDEPVRVTSVISTSPPSFSARGKHDFVFTVDGLTGKEKRTQL